MLPASAGKNRYAVDFERALALAEEELLAIRSLLQRVEKEESSYRAGEVLRDVANRAREVEVAACAVRTMAELARRERDPRTA